MANNPPRRRRVPRERRAVGRPAEGDQRPCPFCRVGAMIFSERAPMHGDVRPVWICRDCGYRTLVRTVPPVASTRTAEALVGRATELHANAQRSMMKSGANYSRAEKRIERTLKVAAHPDALPAAANTVWIDTDASGKIIDWSAGAAALTGYSARSLSGRLIQLIFLAERPSTPQFRQVLLGRAIEKAALIRPRERRAVRVTYRIELAPHSTDREPAMRWTFERAG